MSEASLTHLLWQRLNESPYLMVGISGQDTHSEPMSALFDDGPAAELYFFLKKENRLWRGLESGKRSVMLQYAAKGHDFFACLSGRLEAVHDPKLVDRHWSENVAAWFDGRDDPQLAMVRVRLEDGELWSADLSTRGKLKLMVAGRLDPSELETDRAEVTFAGN
ncbi:MAG: pyridoxamine 5'-phosphate oxidase family protein [Myxococcota bacterium]